MTQDNYDRESGGPRRHQPDWRPRFRVFFAGIVATLFAGLFFMVAERSPLPTGPEPGLPAPSTSRAIAWTLFVLGLLLLTRAFYMQVRARRARRATPTPDASGQSDEPVVIPPHATVEARDD